MNFKGFFAQVLDPERNEFHFRFELILAISDILIWHPEIGEIFWSSMISFHPEAQAFRN